MRKLIPLLTMVLALAACDKKNEMDQELYNTDQVTLMVKGKKVLTFADGNTQYGFNRNLKEFRAGNDDMSSYLVVTCSDLPLKEGQELRADVRWTSGNSVKTTTGLSFKVARYEDTGLVWLWNSADKTGAVVRILY